MESGKPYAATSAKYAIIGAHLFLTVPGTLSGLRQAASDTIRVCRPRWSPDGGGGGQVLHLQQAPGRLEVCLDHTLPLSLTVSRSGPQC